MRRIDEVQQLRREFPAPAVVSLRYRGSAPDDPAELRVLGYVGPGARTVGDIVEGVLVAGEFDEYDTLKALGQASRARDRLDRRAHGPGRRPAGRGRAAST